MTNTKYPDIVIQLTGENGNAFSILARCVREARKLNLNETEINAFLSEAKSSDYYHLLWTVEKWFTTK